MIEELKKLSLENIGNGAAKELFQSALAEVLDNMVDENRETKKEREITLKFKFTPSADRQSAVTKIEVATKLTCIQAPDTFVFMRHEGRKVVGYAQNHKQPSLPFSDVTPLKG